MPASFTHSAMPGGLRPPVESAQFVYFSELLKRPICAGKVTNRLGRLTGLLRGRLEDTLAGYGHGWHVVTVGAKGCVTFRAGGVREFRDFLQIDERLGHLHWLMQHNGGVFLPPWGKVEQWLLSVQHDESDVDRFARNFARLAAAVGG